MPASSIAPRERRVCSARSRAALGSGEGKCMPRARGAPQAASSNAIPARSAVSTSGAEWGCMRAQSTFENRRITRPGPRRPALPARCVEAAFEEYLVTSPLICLATSNAAERSSPESITSCTPGTVSEDSAMLVVHTSRFSPWGKASISSCSALVSRPCRVRTSRLAKALFAAPAARFSSRTPGRNSRATWAGPASRAAAAVCPAYFRKSRPVPRSFRRGNLLGW